MDSKTPLSLLMGHLSSITDMYLASENDQEFIITSDRDEKIRVTKYPQAFEIEAFCLGHEEYVVNTCIFFFYLKTYWYVQLT